MYEIVCSSIETEGLAAVLIKKESIPSRAKIQRFFFLGSNLFGNMSCTDKVSAIVILLSKVFYINNYDVLDFRTRICHDKVERDKLNASGWLKEDLSTYGVVFYILLSSGRGINDNLVSIDTLLLLDTTQDGVD